MRIGLASYGNGIKIEVCWSGRNRRISAAAGEAFAERASVYDEKHSYNKYLFA